VGTRWQLSFPPGSPSVSSLTPFWARVSSHPRPPHTASVAADMKVSSWRTRTEAHHSSEGCLCPTQRLPLHLFTTRWRVCLGACACSLSFLPPFAAGHPCWLVGGGKVGLPLARPPSGPLITPAHPTQRQCIGGSGDEQGGQLVTGAHGRRGHSVWHSAQVRAACVPPPPPPPPPLALRAWRCAQPRTAIRWRQPVPVRRRRTSEPCELFLALTVHPPRTPHSASAARWRSASARGGQVATLFGTRGSSEGCVPPPPRRCVQPRCDALAAPVRVAQTRAVTRWCGGLGFVGAGGAGSHSVWHARSSEGCPLHPSAQALRAWRCVQPRPPRCACGTPCELLRGRGPTPAATRACIGVCVCSHHAPLAIHAVHRSQRAMDTEISVMGAGGAGCHSVWCTLK